jgi:hypothetical protein
MSITLGRNDVCHCGSGKKYKKCHLEKDEAVDRKEREKAALNAAKVMAANAKEEAKEAKDDKGSNPSHTHSDGKKGWVSKLAGKAGFFKSATQRRTPSANKAG